MFVPSAGASAATLRCDDCSFERMAEVAIAHADARGDYLSPVYVVNLPADAVVKYAFTRSRTIDYDRETGTGTNTVTTSALAQAPEPEVAAYVSAAHALLKQQALPPLPPGPPFPGSVYEHAANPSMDSAVNAYIGSSGANLIRIIDTALAAVNPLRYFNPSAIQIKVELRYPDGSSAIFRFNQEIGRWERVAGTERDSHGNVAVIRPSDFVGDSGSSRVFDFEGGNDQDLIHFLQQAQMYGIPIHGTLARRRIVCVSVGGARPECTAMETDGG